MKYPHFDLVGEGDQGLSPSDLRDFGGCVEVGIFTQPDPTGDHAHPDATFVFGEVNGEHLLLSMELTAICFRNPELAARLFELGRDFAQHDKPLQSFVRALRELGISNWQPEDKGQEPPALTA